MADFDTLISDVYKVLETQSFEINLGISHDIKTEKPSLRMSNIGLPLRKLVYDLTRPVEYKLSGSTLFKFKYGDLIEEMFMKLAELAGHKVEHLQETLELDGVTGHTDGVIDGVVIDVKSCSSYAYTKFENGTLEKDDSFGYIDQLSAYWSCLPQYKRAAIIAVNKENGSMCIYELSNKNKRTSEQIKGKIKDTRVAVSSGLEPERCYPDIPDGKSGNRRLGSLCGWCGHKFHCWRDSNSGKGLQVYDYSTGYKYLTHVVKTPKVEEIKEFKVID